MKISTLLICFALISTINLFAQSDPEKRIIATLGPGEVMAYGENCFFIDKNPETFSFVSVVSRGNTKEYYCYGKDGRKTGPVAKPDISYWSECDSKPDGCKIGQTSENDGFEKYISPLDGKIVYNGKTYGPGGMMVGFGISESKKYIYGVVNTSENKLIFYDNTGRQVELQGMPKEIILSPDGKSAVANVSGTFNIYDPEAMQKLLENPEELNNPEIYLYSIDGQTYGPYDPDGFHQTWFTDSGQWVLYHEDDVYLNGSHFLKLQGYYSPCDIWISANGQDYALGTYEFLTFKNGEKYAAPIEIIFYKENGQGFLKWLSLEDGKNLVLYKKPF